MIPAQVAGCLIGEEFSTLGTGALESFMKGSKHAFLLLWS